MRDESGKEPAADCRVSFMADSPLTFIPPPSSLIPPSRLVVARLEVSHLPGGLLGPLWVARAVGNDRSDRQPGSQQRPTLVLLNLDAHRHALHHLGELARD